MSYALIRGVKIDTIDNKVFLKAASNNVCPRTYEWFESESLSKILRDQGKIQVEKEILQAYWDKNFQAGTENLYSKTVAFYKNKLPYTWDNTDDSAKIGRKKYDSLIKYSYDELQEALYQKFLEYKNRDMSKKYVLKYENGYYIRKRAGYQIYFATDRNAKQFSSYEDAFIYAAKITGKPGDMVIEA
jgi:hypothetical protein